MEGYLLFNLLIFLRTQVYLRSHSGIPPRGYSHVVPPQEINACMNVCFELPEIALYYGQLTSTACDMRVCLYLLKLVGKCRHMRDRSDVYTLLCWVMRFGARSTRGPLAESGQVHFIYAIKGDLMVRSRWYFFQVM